MYFYRNLIKIVKNRLENRDRSDTFSSECSLCTYQSYNMLNKSEHLPTYISYVLYDVWKDCCLWRHDFNFRIQITWFRPPSVSTLKDLFNSKSSHTFQTSFSTVFWRENYINFRYIRRSFDLCTDFWKPEILPIVTKFMSIPDSD